MPSPGFALTLPVFTKFDRREIGSFAQADVKSFFRSEAASSLFLERFDVDGDGSITFDEFFATMQKFVDEHGELSWTERIYITFSEPGSSKLGFWISIYIMALILMSTGECQPESSLDGSCCGLNTTG